MTPAYGGTEQITSEGANTLAYLNVSMDHSTRLRTEQRAA